MGTKINQLLKAWPHGTVASTSWLETQGVYRQLIAEYGRSAWIRRVGHGAYIRDGDSVGWDGGLYAIQKHLMIPIHAAAKTALEIHGFAHFIGSGPGKSIYLFGAPRSKLPAWFKQYDWQVTIHFTAANLFSGPPDLGLTEKIINRYSIQISSRERAVLELLCLIPHDQAFDEAKLLFEGLRTLRPELLQQLLECCRSIKVKRLFLYFSDLTNQPWLKKLNVSKINLGSGKRVIAEGGLFNQKYNISVPKISTGGDNDELEGA